MLQSCNNTAVGPPPVPHVDTSKSQEYSYSINDQIFSEVQAILFETLGDEADHNSHQESLRVMGRGTGFPALWASVSLDNSPSSTETLLNNAWGQSGDTG